MTRRKDKGSEHMANMKKYLIIDVDNVYNTPFPTVDNSEIISASNIDNLRRNLCKKLSKGRGYAVYSNGRFYGILYRMGKKTIRWQTKDGKARKQTWPEVVWISNYKEYACSEKDGTIRRM